MDGLEGHLEIFWLFIVRYPYMVETVQNAVFRSYLKSLVMVSQVWLSARAQTLKIHSLNLYHFQKRKFFCKHSGDCCKCCEYSKIQKWLKNIKKWLFCTPTRTFSCLNENAQAVLHFLPVFLQSIGHLEHFKWSENLSILDFVNWLR